MLTIIFSMLLIGIVYAKTYVQSFANEENLQVKKEILEQRVEDNEITEEEADKIYKNIKERMTNCNNICEQNENCTIYQQNNNCMKQHHQYNQKNYNNTNNCNKQQNCNNKMWNR